MQESRMGGMEYNSIHLAKAMDPAKFKIIFFCPAEGKLTQELRKNNLYSFLYKRPPFFSTSIRISGRYFFNPLATLYNFLAFFLIIPSLALNFKKERVQFVVCKGLLANFYGPLASKFAGISCIWDMQEIILKEKCFGLMRCVLNFWAHRAKGIIAPAKAVRDQFSEEIKKKIVLIPNGIDTDYYSPEVDRRKVRKEWGIGDQEILIGHIARFTYWKGQKVFVQAALEISKEIPHAKFVLVGSPVFEDDAYEKEVKKMADESGFRERFLFPGFRDDLKHVLAALDIFAHSSIEPEGCPLTLLAAMSMGKPVVATRVQGNDEIVNEGQAILVSPNQPDEMAHALLKTIHDKAFSQNLSRLARQRILTQYSLQTYARKCGDFFTSLYAE